MTRRLGGEGRACVRGMMGEWVLVCATVDRARLERLRTVSPSSFRSIQVGPDCTPGHSCLVALQEDIAAAWVPPQIGGEGGGEIGGTGGGEGGGGEGTHSIVRASSSPPKTPSKGTVAACDSNEAVADCGA